MKQLEEFGIPYEVKVASAHRKPAEVHEWASGAEGRGMRVIVAAAGRTARSSGVVAAYTPLPVIAVPMKTSDLGGLDSLLSMVQMPSGVPVACVAINGAKTLRFSRCKCSAQVAMNAARRFPILKRRWLNNDEEIAHRQQGLRACRARAGVAVVAGYPGTPSSELIETVAKRVQAGAAENVHVEWSTNERRRSSLLAGASYADARTLFTCKQLASMSRAIRS